MPRTRKIRLPKKYTTKQMTRIATLVRRAQRCRARSSMSPENARNIDTEKNGDRMKNTFVKTSKNSSTLVSLQRVSTELWHVSKPCVGGWPRPSLAD